MRLPTQFPEDRVFGPRQEAPFLRRRCVFSVPEWPDFDSGDFDRIKHMHRDGIGALVRKVASDADTQFLVCLPHINGLIVEVIEGVYPTLRRTNGPVVAVARFKELFELRNHRLYVRCDAVRTTETALAAGLRLSR